MKTNSNKKIVRLHHLSAERPTGNSLESLLNSSRLIKRIQILIRTRGRPTRSRFVSENLAWTEQTQPETKPRRLGLVFGLEIGLGLGLSSIKVTETNTNTRLKTNLSHTVRTLLASSPPPFLITSSLPIPVLTSYTLFCPMTLRACNPVLSWTGPRELV